MAGLSPDKVLYNIYCKSDPNLFLKADGNEVILTQPNSSDESQHWHKYKNTDEGSFAVVNKQDTKAMKQVTVKNTVELKNYVDLNDESILWVTNDPNDGYSNIIIPGDSNDNLAWDVNEGKAVEGARLVIDRADNTPTQRWKFARIEPGDSSKRPGEEKTTE